MNVIEFDFKFISIECGVKANIIKARFIDYLLGSDASLDLICSELLFHDGLRRADLATLNSEGLHAYEIKSRSDDLRKLSPQLAHYMECFNSVSIITDGKHLSKIRSAVDKKIGLFVAEDGVITLVRKPVRIAKPNKASRLHMLTKTELIFAFKELFGKEGSAKIEKKNDKTFIIDLICKIVNSKRIMQETEKIVFEKHRNKYEVFLAERGKITLEEDILLLHQAKSEIV